jgi:hypothetical protein
MPLYTFYPCRPDGESLTFVSQDLADDSAAFWFALEVCQKHPSCTHVNVCGDRRVLTRERVNPPERVLSRSTGPSSSTA